MSPFPSEIHALNLLKSLAHDVFDGQMVRWQAHVHPTLRDRVYVDYLIEKVQVEIGVLHFHANLFNTKKGLRSVLRDLERVLRG